MRPALRPGLLPVWRDRETVQIGTDPRRAVALTNMRQAARAVSLLDGSRDRAQFIAEASQSGIPADVTERLLTLLAASGALIDFPSRLFQSMPLELRQSLQPGLAAASVSRQDADGGASLLARRSQTFVSVCGRPDLTATTLTFLLTESGLCAKLAPEADLARLDIEPDLIVLIGHQTPDVATQLVRQRSPHLAVTASEAIGAVGPLVRPGTTACLRCIDLARSDADPAWPLVLAQRADRDTDPAACDPVLATAVAAQAAALVVAYADRAPVAQTLANGVLELVLPAWQWRRTTWRPHPACICRPS